MEMVAEYEHMASESRLVSYIDHRFVNAWKCSQEFIGSWGKTD